MDGAHNRTPHTHTRTHNPIHRHKLLVACRFSFLFPTFFGGSHCVGFWFRSSFSPPFTLKGCPELQLINFPWTLSKSFRPRKSLCPSHSSVQVVGAALVQGKGESTPYVHFTYFVAILGRNPPCCCVHRLALVSLVFSTHLVFSLSLPPVATPVTRPPFG